MANIVNLDELVPEDIVFEFREKQYVVPGDLDTETVFKVFQHLRSLYDSRPEDGSPMTEEAVKQAAASLEDLLISIFQIRDPSLRGPLPFGARAMGIVTEKILAALGIGGDDEDDGGEKKEPIPTVRASRSPKKSSPASTRPSRTKR